MKKTEPGEARVLLDCQYGRVNDVVKLTPAELIEAERHGLVDSKPEAVAFAKALPKPKAA